MSYNSDRFGVRRRRSPDGTKRRSKVLSVRDVSPLTEYRIGRIAEEYSVPRGRVLDAAIDLLWFDLGHEGKPNGQSNVQPKIDLTWVMRPDERLSAEEFPEIASLERKLEESRRRCNEIMGRVD